MSYNIIHTYTRAEAIADGVLIDVSAMAREAGFKIPVAVTSAVHAKYVEVPAEVDWQDEAGRLWDILWMCSWEARRQGGKSMIFFSLDVQNDTTGLERVQLKCICGPNDDGSPCLTILLPDED